MTRRILLDTEWTAAPWSARSELMWIGVADEEGRSWYGISSEVEIVGQAHERYRGRHGESASGSEGSRQPHEQQQP
jgi:hypothetical protein